MLAGYERNERKLCSLTESTLSMCIQNYCPQSTDRFRLCMYVCMRACVYVYACTRACICVYVCADSTRTKLIYVHWITLASEMSLVNPHLSPRFSLILLLFLPSPIFLPYFLHKSWIHRSIARIVCSRFHERSYSPLIFCNTALETVPLWNS